MTQRSVTHAIFTLERSYKHPVRKVWDAFATEEGKMKWFGGVPREWDLLQRAFDFREGGVERLEGRWSTGRISDFQARYLDIVPHERIVYVYEMWIDGTKISASLASIEFKPTAGGTELKVTEQGAFLDGYDDAGSREHGTGILLDQVGVSLDKGTGDGVFCG
jgi:uncharacterized protein YndB with AHSA1/START domain